MKSEEGEKGGFWTEGAFAQTMGGAELKEKMKTFHKKHDEDVNYGCKKCNKKISAHNRDWHGGMCDGCFGKAQFP